jgi:putative oligomerization/nucleic acid binding protein/phospholipase D-like protein
VLVAADYPFLDVLWTMLIFFLWVIWFWLLIVIFGDIFRRNDISGWSKAAWSLFVIFLPLLGVLIYLGVNSQGMSERSARATQAAQTQADDYIRTVAASGGAAGEIEKAKQLLDSGAIDAQEYEALKRKALAAGPA